jgi:ATP-dependent DNA helicase RecG
LVINNKNDKEPGLILNFGLFARMHLLKQVGSGIGRIQDLMQGVGLPEPDFPKKGILKVMLKRPVKSSLKSSLKIIELISQNIQITILELADQIGINIQFFLDGM